MFRLIPSLRHVRRLMHYLRPHLGQLLLAALTMLLVTGIHLARPLILRELIDNALPRGDAGLALQLGLLFVGVLALGAGALYGRALLLARVGTSTVARLKSDLLAHLLAQGMAFFDRHAPGKLINRVENDIEQMRGLVSGASAQLMANTLLLAAIGTMIWYQEPGLGVWLLAALAVCGVAIALYARFVREMYREVRERDSEMASRLTEFVQGVSLLRLFGREEEAVQRVVKATQHRCDLEQRAGFYDTVLFYGGFTLLAEIGSMAVLIWYGTAEVFAGRMTVGTLVMFLELMRRFFGPLRELAEVLIQLQSGLAATGRVFALLDLPREGEGAAAQMPVEEPAETTRLRVLPDQRFGQIEFHQVGFQYGEKRVLDEVSFRVHRGQRVALVGASGSGKSTCINLLLRFYDPTSGAILIDGDDLQTIAPEEWRKRLSLVLQEIHLFPGTVLENLKAFAPDVPNGRVEAAARELGAHPFIERLPQGYQTVLAERGANLSLGERQLLCYVRALVRNPQLLILDEATSAVDAVTERRLQEAMQRLMRGRTAVIIAHRLSTIVAVDRILVLENGRLVESGTHDELMRRKGHYRHLASLQGLDAAQGARPIRRRARERVAVQGG